MSVESHSTPEQVPHGIPRFLEENEKTQYKAAVLSLLKEYPGNFFPGLFEEFAENDYEQKQVAVAFDGESVIGCLFFDRATHECDWLAISKTVTGSKKEVAKKLFQTIFDSVAPGTKVFWYINTEDAVFEGKPVGENFERGRNLYSEMGAHFTRVENKFGERNHAYLVGYTT